MSEQELKDNYPNFLNPLNCDFPIEGQAYGAVPNFVSLSHGRPHYHSVYHDLTSAALQHGARYTFQVYLAKPSAGMQGGAGTQHRQNNHQGGGDPAWDSATSGIITLMNIDSSNSYTRLTVDFTNSTSAIEKSGTSSGFSDLLAARCSVISQQGIFEDQLYPELDQTWYKMEVSLPYDKEEFANNHTAVSEDPVNVQPNHGLRCVIQAYNSQHDGGLSNDIHRPNEPIDIPTSVSIWGPSLTKSDVGATWIRELGSAHYSGTNQQEDVMVYVAQGNIIDLSEGNLNRQRVINVDKEGEMTYLEPNTSSLNKLTVAIPTPGGLYPAKLITKPNIYDANLSLVSGTNIILNEAKQLVYNTNLLQVSSGIEGTNISKCILGKVPLEPRELLHMFRYFNSIGQVARGSGFNTRVAVVGPDTVAEVHASGGGSRSSYRTHPDSMNVAVSGTTHRNFTNIGIYN